MERIRTLEVNAFKGFRSGIPNSKAMRCNKETNVSFSLHQEKIRRDEDEKAQKC